MNVRSYSFNDRYVMSTGIAANDSISNILIEQIPGATMARLANEKEDRSGVDWWIEHIRGQALAVDVKVRDDDYAVSPPSGRQAADDLALERWSVVEKQKVGWTLDESKRCDYILWFWRSTGRWCLVPFPMLCTVFRENLAQWDHFQHATQWTPYAGGGGYHSECIFVPRKVIWRAIYLRYAGQLKKAGDT